MKMNSTKKQYKHSLDLLYLGEWSANSSKEGEDVNKEYDDFVQYVYSFAKDFSYNDIITYETKFDAYYPTLAYEKVCKHT
ncbi:hypothetical protein Q73_13415 [Bacillus coahuilensis m2-6]|uniref:hypothetical protein n=1 Tax=Bacillus coahuilensis TaxID=408580 RepID=UPI0001850A0C|nr:hypothetical protein [Bacillus coahuilensis]KUP05306.1 hypothetical protein Q73_13415 [Bacillus coahuilensis m2-6]